MTPPFRSRAHANAASRIATFGATCASSTLLSLSSGSVGFDLIHRSIAARSYVRPVVSTIAGCDIIACVMGHTSASGASSAQSRITRDG